MSTLTPPPAPVPVAVEVPTPARPVREHPIEELRVLPRKPVGRIAPYEHLCQGCGARTQSVALSEQCQFCAAPLVAEPGGDGQIVPEAVLPFALDRRAVREVLRRWSSSRWFAPSALKRIVHAESTKGTYVPHWTFDSFTVSRYEGSHGKHYYTTSSSTDSSGNTQTTQVRHTRWRPAAGEVRRFFDDVLVLGSHRLDAARMVRLEPWPLAESVPFHPDLLAGHHTLRYEVEPERAFQIARGRMDRAVHADVCRDIGGDAQRVRWVHTTHHRVTYKLVLLPVWLACYVYAGKQYSVMVNARTAEVLGERPFSAGKIAAAITGSVLTVATLLILLLALS
ncbi:MAG: hypothetical protein WCA46_28460 [Actinocatenispora sp.]